MCDSSEWYSEVYFEQAEDGMGDIGETGVKTCALQISSPRDNTGCLRSYSRGVQGRSRTSAVYQPVGSHPAGHRRTNQPQSYDQAPFRTSSGFGHGARRTAWNKVTSYRDCLYVDHQRA